MTFYSMTSHSYKSLEHSQMTFALITYGRIVTTLETVPNLTMQTFNIYLASIFSFWFGCSFLGLLESFFLKVRKGFSRKRLSKKIIRRLIWFGCLVSLNFHFYETLREFLNYDITTQTWISLPESVSIPSISFSFFHYQFLPNQTSICVNTKDKKRVNVIKELELKQNNENNWERVNSDLIDKQFLDGFLYSGNQIMIKYSFKNRSNKPELSCNQKKRFRCCD